MTGVFGQRAMLGQGRGPDVELVVDGNEWYANYETPAATRLSTTRTSVFSATRACGRAVSSRPRCRQPIRLRPASSRTLVSRTRSASQRPANASERGTVNEKGSSHECHLRRGADLRPEERARRAPESLSATSTTPAMKTSTASPSSTTSSAGCSAMRASRRTVPLDRGRRSPSRRRRDRPAPAGAGRGPQRQGGGAAHREDAGRRFAPKSASSGRSARTRDCWRAGSSRRRGRRASPSWSTSRTLPAP